MLEEFLDTSLFKRAHRRIQLTEAGQMLLPGIQQGLAHIDKAVRNVESIRNTKPIVITTPPSFAIKWLVPRLKHFRTDFPDIDVRIDTNVEVVDLVQSDIDIAIRFGQGGYPGLQSELLMCQEVFPVCSPSIIDPDHPLDHPSDLRYYEMLKFDEGSWDSEWPDWQMWLLALGIDDIDTSRGGQGKGGEEGDNSHTCQLKNDKRRTSK